MATLAPPLLQAAMMRWDNNPRYPSASFSGIVGDTAHAGKGYHIALQDLSSQSDYSAVRVNDKAPPGTWPRNLASAGDMSMSTTDMVKVWNVFYAVWADQSDPRREFFNAVNGWNGKGDAERLDFKANTRTVASSDHKWHTHLEWCRKYANDPTAMAALDSILNGETKAQWLASRGGNGQSTGTTTGVGSDMYVVNFNGRYVFTNGRTYKDIPNGDILDKCVAASGGISINVGNQADFNYFAGALEGSGDAVTVNLNPKDVDAMAKQISDALVASNTNGLTEADHHAIKEDVKDVLLHGAGS